MSIYSNYVCSIFEQETLFHDLFPDTRCDNLALKGEQLPSSQVVVMIVYGGACTCRGSALQRSVESLNFIIYSCIMIIKFLSF